jgi:hypothetical protein
MLFDRLNGGESLPAAGGMLKYSSLARLIPEVDCSCLMW